MSNIKSWCLLCGKDPDHSVAVKNLSEGLRKTISSFTKIRSTDKGAPKNICTNCDTFIRLYEKQKEHYQKVQEMFVFALKKNRKPEELIDLRTKFKVSDELQDWKSLCLLDVKVKVEKLDTSLYQSFTVDSFEETPNPETDFLVKAEPMSPRAATPVEIIPFLPSYSPQSDLPNKFDNSPPSQVEDSDSGGLSDHFEFTGVKRKRKYFSTTPKTTYECDFCGFTICWRAAIVRHIKDEHMKHMKVNKIFKCEKCPKTYQQINSLKAHFKRKHETKPFPKFCCQQCDKEYVTKGELKQHVLSVHEKRRDYQCSICSKMFPTKSSMKLHEETHTETKDFQCTICSKRWNTAIKLKRHIARHNSIACFCDICGAELVSAKQLKRHKEFVHSGKTPHSCIVCGKQFSRLTRYKDHLIAIHTDLRPFVCNYCNRTFNNGPNFAKHKRESHPEEFAEEKKCIDPKGTKLPSIEELHARIQAEW